MKQKIYEFVLGHTEFVVAKAFLEDSVWCTIGTWRCQSGKCKSGRIIHEREFREIVDE